ncbi:aarF domain-containing protein kinase 1 isoform X2 [Eucyclogobius newberryi]|uniref:aarF domain-containing protein kinase 1 isoform X2 n=1 Tax=Eucyclogobius newberryi TaxID=166745 RepID=UPI003B5A5D23
MAARVRRLSAVTAVVLASSGLYLHRKQVDINDLSVVRFGRAAATTFLISYDYLTAFRHVENDTEEYWELKSKVHQRSAERLRDLCCANRGTFIKVGQHLGALDYLLPAEYTSTLKILHSRAPQSSMEEIRQVIKEDLGKELSEIFVSFDEHPQGAASLAQVHRAVLHDGRAVAVKVQHPKVQTQSAKDILVMEVLVKAVHWLFPDFAFMWLLEEAKKNMPLELDFLNEGKNAEKVAKMLSHFAFLQVPKIYWDLSTKRILTMDFADGSQVNDKEYIEKQGINVNEVLQPDFRVEYCKLWQALINQDLKEMEQSSRRLGAGDLYPLFVCVLTARSWTAVNSGISAAPITHSEEMEIRTNAARYLPQISDLLNRIPRQMLLLLKTNDLLRGIESTLQTRASSSSFINMSRCCVRALARHKRSKCKSRLMRLQISVSEQVTLCKLSVFQLCMWLRSCVLGQWLFALL